MNATIYQGYTESPERIRARWERWRKQADEFRQKQIENERKAIAVDVATLVSRDIQQKVMST